MLPSETSEHAQFFDSDKRFEQSEAVERLERFERASVLCGARHRFS
jgi:hypothetical protein